MSSARIGLALVAALTASSCAASVVESNGPRGQAPADAAVVETSITPPQAAPTGGASAASEPTDTTPLSAVPTETAAPPAAPTETVAPLTGWPAVDQYLDVTIVRGGSSAVSVAVMRDGALEHHAAIGVRTSPGAEPVDSGDRFRVASISKTITAITMLQLVENGVVGLDSAVGGLLAERVGVAAPAAGVADITVGDLLTHRSGFGQYEDLFFRNEVDSCRAAAVVGLSRSMRADPGTTFQYSNLNFCLLGIAIEALTGKTYEAVVHEQLLTPLGIDGMRLAGTFDVGDGDVEHRSDEGRNYMEVLGAAGAWIASPTDLVTILNSLDPATPGWKPLDATTLEMMKTVTTDPVVIDPEVIDPVTSEPVVPESGYGMGLMIFGPGAVGHTGTVESTHAMVVARPDGITWAITVSGDYPSSTRQLARIMSNALLLGGFMDGAYVDVPPPIGAD